MAPNRAKARAHSAQPQPPPQPSDYETDAPPAMDVPLPPPRSNEELNLSVIRRHYPEVIAIHYVASYTVLYVYSLDSNQWERTGTEGSLFVCELFPSPTGVERFSVFMLNRKGLENFTMEITSPEDIEIDDFIIMQSDQIYGLWVHSDPPPSSTANARVETQAKIKELAARAQASREAHEGVSENGTTIGSEHLEASVPMGRQLSLRELFGQQREQEPAWNVPGHAHQAAQAGFPPMAGSQPTQPDVLSQLFMKAKQDYNGLG